MLQISLGPLLQRRLTGKQTLRPVWVRTVQAATAGPIIVKSWRTVLVTVVLTPMIVSFLRLPDMIALLPVIGDNPHLKKAQEYITSRSEFRRNLWNNDMRDLLVVFGKLTRAQSYGILGAMEDCFDSMPILTPMPFTLPVRLVSLLMIALDLFGPISEEDRIRMRKEILRRMPSRAYRKAIWDCQCMYVMRLPYCSWVSDGGVFLGVEVALTHGLRVPDAWHGLI